MSIALTTSAMRERRWRPWRSKPVPRRTLEKLVGALMKGRLIDVSHVVEDGMITYRGLPAPLICDYLSREQSRAVYAPGTEFHIGRIDMVANTGTYLDSPFHRYADGKDLSQLPLNRLANLERL